MRQGDWSSASIITCHSGFSFQQSLFHSTDRLFDWTYLTQTLSLSAQGNMDKIGALSLTPPLSPSPLSPTLSLLLSLPVSLTHRPSAVPMACSMVLLPSGSSHYELILAPHVIVTS